MSQYENTNVLKPVSPDTLKIFDSLRLSVEEEVLAECLTSDNPEQQMGPDAGRKIKTGLDFISKMFHATMAFGAPKIVENDLEWGRVALPGYGVSMQMVLNNFKRYAAALEKKMASDAFQEIQPYLADIINRQSAIAKEAKPNNA